MTIRLTQSTGYMRPVEDMLPDETLPRVGDIIPLNVPPFVGHFRVDEIEPPMTGDNPHRSIPLIYVHNMYREY